MKLFILLALLALLPSPAAACSCRRGTTLAEAFEASGAVVVAQVSGPVEQRDEPFGTVYEIEVESMWKGDKSLIKRRMKLVTSGGGGDCGRGKHMTNGRWILIVQHRDDALSTTLCDLSEPATKRSLAKMRGKFGPPTPVVEPKKPTKKKT